ncbi:hypothetical protein BH10PLA2_BH10PLA2_28130 [soil metagenome]
MLHGGADRVRRILVSGTNGHSSTVLANTEDWPIYKVRAKSAANTD